MVTAYSMLANGGKRIKPTLVDRVQDRWGNTIYRHDERACDGCDAASWTDQAEPKLVDKREQVIDPYDGLSDHIDSRGRHHARARARP